MRTDRELSEQMAGLAGYEKDAFHGSKRLVVLTLILMILAGVGLGLLERWFNGAGDPAQVEASER